MVTMIATESKLHHLDLVQYLFLSLYRQFVLIFLQSKSRVESVEATNLMVMEYVTALIAWSRWPHLIQVSVTPIRWKIPNTQTGKSKLDTRKDRIQQLSVWSCNKSVLDDVIATTTLSYTSHNFLRYPRLPCRLATIFYNIIKDYQQFFSKLRWLLIISNFLYKK